MHRCVPTYEACCGPNQQLSAGKMRQPTRQPTVVQHGVWLEDVLAFLRELGSNGDLDMLAPGEARDLLARYEALGEKDDRRR